MHARHGYILLYIVRILLYLYDTLMCDGRPNRPDKHRTLKIDRYVIGASIIHPCKHM
jgi:hypothetical protein